MKKNNLIHLNLFSLAAALSVIMAPGVATATALAGIVNSWNFDEGPDWHDSPLATAYSGTSAADSVGTATLTLKNMAAANWVSGRQFTGLEFNGTNQYLKSATSLGATLGGTSSFSFWIRTTQTGKTSSSLAPGVAGSASSTAVQAGWIDNTGCIGFSVGNTLAVKSAAAVNDGEWHHVVFTRNSTTGAAAVYVDGALSASATGPTGVKSGSFTSVGRIENGLSAVYLKGRLDQVSIFNQVVTAATVSSLYKNHAPKAWAVTARGVNTRSFTTASVFSKCYDVELDTLSVSSFTQPAHGTVTHNGDGSFTYTATTGYLGEDAFNVVIEDGNGNYRLTTLRVVVEAEPTGLRIPVTVFQDFAPVQSSGADISLSGLRVPRVVDMNADGKKDLLIGQGGYVWRYLNTGTTSAPVFGAAAKVQAAGTDITSGNSNSPIALADLTGDGVKDLLLVDSSSKLRIYKNTATASNAPVYSAYTLAKISTTTDLVLSDVRFDVGDWNGDGLPDIVTGTYSSNLLLYLNTGTATAPRFGTGQTLFGGSYNLYPRLCDLNGNGTTDLVWADNWGGLFYRRGGGTETGTLSVTTSTGSPPDLHGLTDGAVMDFADLNGDDIPDLIMGGHAGTRVSIAYGSYKTPAQSIAAIEAIYDANLSNLGPALSADDNKLLKQINAHNLNLVNHILYGGLTDRETVYTALSTHISRYDFLKYKYLDPAVYYNVPGIALQNWIMLGSALPDTSARRTATADTMGLTGEVRTIYLENRVAFGDNALSSVENYASIRDLLRRHPRELFPDDAITVDAISYSGTGGYFWRPNNTKNIFAANIGIGADEWAGDLAASVDRVLGPRAHIGVYYTLVLGHEVIHSLDKYVRARANADLNRRWGLMLCTAAGPDIIPGTNGWMDGAATKANFQTKGFWNGVEADWPTAWNNYWHGSGAGSAFVDLSFMRKEIDWFLATTQESLATQGNQHWVNARGRLIGAVDRFRRATTPALAPLKANINEVVTFIDFVSAGLNRINLPEVSFNSASEPAVFTDHYADLVRDDKGRIIRILVEGTRYDLVSDSNGVVTDVTCSIVLPAPDNVAAVSGTATPINVLANDSRLDGKTTGLLPAMSFTQPVYGTVSAGTGGQLVYQSKAGYFGPDSFTYTVGGVTVSVTVTVTNSDAATPAWAGQDIFHDSGQMGGPGAYSYDAAAGTHTLRSSGIDVWDTQDAFRFVSREITGDCDIRARVVSQTWTSQYAKAGVMIRETTAAGSKNVAAEVMTGYGFALQYRSTLDAGSAGVQGPSLNTYPNNWVRLVRAGDLLTGYSSSDGQTWTEISSVTLPMNSTLQAGLFASSNNISMDEIAVFDKVSINSVPSPWNSTDIGAVGISGGVIQKSGVFYQEASGTDISGAGDQFRYTWQAASGDCSITAKVEAIANTAAWAKSGVMIRESLDTGSPYSATLLSFSNGVTSQSRATANTNSTATTETGYSTPFWVRVTRVGNTFTSSRSSNGTTWTAIASQTVTMGSNVYIGIASTATNNSALGSTRISNVSATP